MDKVHFESHSDPYENLAIAVVNTTVIDYRNCCREIKKEHDEKKINYAKHKKYQIEKFFRSHWGNILCFGYADLILERLKKEQEND